MRLALAIAFAFVSGCWRPNAPPALKGVWDRSYAAHGVCERPCYQWARDNGLQLPAVFFNPKTFECTCATERDFVRGPDRYVVVTFELGLPAGDSL